MTTVKIIPDGQVLLDYIKTEFLQFKIEFTELLNKINEDIETLTEKVVVLEDELKHIRIKLVDLDQSKR